MADVVLLCKAPAQAWPERGCTFAGLIFPVLICLAGDFEQKHTVLSKFHSLSYPQDMCFGRLCA